VVALCELTREHANPLHPLLIPRSQVRNLPGPSEDPANQPFLLSREAAGFRRRCPRRSVLRGVGSFLVNPLTRGRAITLTFEQFKYGWANALDEKEAKELYDTFHVAGSGISLVQMGNANLNPWTQAKVNTKNPERGPLLIIDGEKDHTVPWAIANAAYKRQKRNPAVTEIVKMPNRGHALTIDHGWREVARTALAFVKRFV
jgi:non-heme chloroperoxidase